MPQWDSNRSASGWSLKGSSSLFVVFHCFHWEAAASHQPLTPARVLREELAGAAVDGLAAVAGTGVVVPVLGAALLLTFCLLVSPLADAGALALQVVVYGGVAVLLLHLAPALTLHVFDGLHLVEAGDSLSAAASSASLSSAVAA